MTATITRPNGVRASRRTARKRLRRRRLFAILVALTAVLGIASGVEQLGPPPQPKPDGPSGSWHLTFNDSFTGNTLNRHWWSTCYDWDCTNAGNNELEWYKPGNVTVSDGLLHLTARQQTAHGKPYTSGMIQSNHKYVFRYGYMQIRTKLPAGRGMWPAFWTLSTDHSWPPEIDVFEALGDRPSRITMTVHTDERQTIQTALSGIDFTAGYHDLGVDWEPGSLTWYVDGIVRMHENVSITKPQYLLVDLAVSGYDPPGSSTVLPARMDVASVRVWQHPGTPVLLPSGRQKR
ncbi:MAG: glycoside hydrolase family 16 protein [Acidimicrobiales bacterium]